MISEKKTIIPEQREKMQMISEKKTADMYETAKRCIINAYDEFMADDVKLPTKREISDKELKAVWKSMKRSIEDFDANDSGSGRFVSLSDDVKYPLEFIYGVKGAKRRILEQAELVAAHLRKSNIELPRRYIFDRTIRGLERLADQKLPPSITHTEDNFDILLPLATFVKGKEEREKLLTRETKQPEKQGRKSALQMYSHILREYKKCARTFPKEKEEKVEIQMSDSPIPLWQIISDVKHIVKHGMNTPFACGKTINTLGYLWILNPSLSWERNPTAPLKEEMDEVAKFVAEKAKKFNKPNPNPVEREVSLPTRGPTFLKKFRYFKKVFEEMLNEQVAELVDVSQAPILKDIFPKHPEQVKALRFMLGTGNLCSILPIACGEAQTHDSPIE